MLCPGLYNLKHSTSEPRKLWYQVIFLLSFGIIKPIQVTLKISSTALAVGSGGGVYVCVGRGGGGEVGVGNGRMHVHMKKGTKTESPIFVHLRVLCFQRQPFRFLFVYSVDTGPTKFVQIIIKKKCVPSRNCRNC